jgi:hypothetical protein
MTNLLYVSVEASSVALNETTQLAAKVTQLSAQWRSAQIVRTKEKVCEWYPGHVASPLEPVDPALQPTPSPLTPVAFLFGVLSLTFSSILYGAAPEWLPFAYTAQSAFYIPTRIYTYKRKAWHYFLFEWVESPPHHRWFHRTS